MFINTDDTQVAWPGLISWENEDHRRSKSRIQPELIPEKYLVARVTGAVNRGWIASLLCFHLSEKHMGIIIKTSKEP